MSRISLLVAIVLLAASCQSNSKQIQQYTNYPDLKGFFNKEIKRLASSKPKVKKTVHINKQSETKSNAAINWEQELDLFIASDINKPAFLGKYTVTKTDSEAVYVATEPKLRTREIKILYQSKNKIKRISISNHKENTLYTSDEYLEYCPDSVYQIVKRQEVLIMGTNNYWIFGEFVK